MFISDIDGFFYQIMSVSNNENLGSLAIMHTIRYIISYPFYITNNLNLPSFLDNIFLIIYLSPVLFFIKLPSNIKVVSLLLLFLSIFFSYRTILVMTSIYMLIIHIKFTKISYKYLFISFIYSFLSSGTLLVWIFIVIYFKDLFIQNKKINIYINIFILIVLLVMLGPISHKLLFFIDSSRFGSAEMVTMDAIFNISINDLLSMISNILDRSLIKESFEMNNYIRITILFIELIMMLFVMFYSFSKLNIIIFNLFIFSLLFEGLMAYSLFFSIFILFYSYVSENLKKVLSEKNITK